MLGLLVAGVVIGVAGLLSVGFAYPMKDFSFGNTLIISGVMAACTGVLLVAASLLLRELQAISAALGGAAPRIGIGEGDVKVRAVDGPPQASPFVPPPDEPSSPPAWQADPGPADAANAPADAGLPQRRRRNLLFMSTKRDRPAGDQGAAGEEQLPAQAADAEPAGPATFEDAWPASDRNRPEPRPSPVPPRATEPPPPPPRPPLPPRRSEPPPVTVLKSGVVDGMAYSLYSDGSIEAQLPEGMVRFASIDELRHHLDQRG